MNVTSIKFWKSHINWFIPFVSELYPLSKFQLIQYEELLDWDRIKSNSFIRWDIKMKRTFSDKLSQAKKHPPSSVDVIMDDDGVKVPVQVTLGYPKSKDVYFRINEQRNSDQYYWKNINFGFYDMPKYDEDAVMMIIEKFVCGIHIGMDPTKSLPIPTGFLELRKEELDWEFFSCYWALNWSFELLKQFEDYWVTEKLIGNHTTFNYCLKEDLDDEFIEKVLS